MRSKWSSKTRLALSWRMDQFWVGPILGRVLVPGLEEHTDSSALYLTLRSLSLAQSALLNYKGRICRNDGFPLLFHTPAYFIRSLRAPHVSGLGCLGRACQPACLRYLALLLPVQGLDFFNPNLERLPPLHAAPPCVHHHSAELSWLDFSPCPHNISGT